MNQRGWGKRGQDLMAICHDARKGRHIGSHWSKPARLHSTRPLALLLNRSRSEELRRATSGKRYTERHAGRAICAQSGPNMEVC